MPANGTTCAKKVVRSSSFREAGLEQADDRLHPPRGLFASEDALSQERLQRTPAAQNWKSSGQVRCTALRMGVKRGLLFPLHVETNRIHQSLQEPPLDLHEELERTTQAPPSTQDSHLASLAGLFVSGFFVSQGHAHGAVLIAENAVASTIQHSWFGICSAPGFKCCLSHRSDAAD